MQFVGRVDLMGVCVGCQHGVILKVEESMLQYSYSKCWAGLLLALRTPSSQGLKKLDLSAQTHSRLWHQFCLEVEA